MQKIKASHILVKDLNQANQLKEAVQAGANFAELALAHSACPSKQNGGDLGFFSRGAMVKTFEEAAFGLEVGQLSDVVYTQFGFHLILRTA